MRTFTSLCAILICSFLHPGALKAQDSQVTTGDNGGQGQLGHPGKKGGQQMMTNIPQIGVDHSDPKGNGIQHGKQSNGHDDYDVQETGKTPFCLEAMNTDNDGNTLLLNSSWTLVVTDGSHPITLSWDPANPEIVIEPPKDPSTWKETGNLNHNPTDIYLTNSSQVASATLAVGTNAPISYKRPSGSTKHISFKVHYCGVDGCGGSCH